MPISTRLIPTLVCSLLLCPVFTQADEGQTLHDLMDREWEWSLREAPTTASYFGIKTYNDRWPDVSPAAIERRHEHRLEVLEELAEIDTELLTKSDRINYRLFRRKYETEVEAHRYRWYLAPMTARDGIQFEEQTAEYTSFDSVRDYEDWIARLETFDTYVDQTIDLLRTGVDSGIVQARVVMQRVPNQIKKQLVDDPTKSLYYKPFQTMPRSIAADQQNQLRQRGVAAIRDTLIPAYRKLLLFFEETYLPACFEKVGVWQIPNGKEFYAHRAKMFTTTDLTPEQIHEIGMAEVKRIRGEMEAIVKQVGFEGSFREFLHHLRTDPRFYYDTENELLMATQAVCKKVDPQLVKLFKTLPRMPYGVQAIPANIAPDTTAAYYREPALNGTRAGTYFVNLYKPESRPKYEIEVLSLHEAVPGHHLQIALAQELVGLPEFRRAEGYTAFIEGWALYSESLGEEIGLYQDPYSKFGQLTYEMWRAVRLVVDTGMHHYGWSRERAIAMLADNSAKTMLDIENEIDRYIAWPGQALAYKIGELKIKELRAKAERELEEKFDVREFHDVVLLNGAVTLDVLEEIVNEWIEEAK